MSLKLGSVARDRKQAPSVDEEGGTVSDRFQLRSVQTLLTHQQGATLTDPLPPCAGRGLHLRDCYSTDASRCNTHAAPKRPQLFFNLQGCFAVKIVHYLVDLLPRLLKPQLLFQVC